MFLATALLLGARAQLASAQLPAACDPEHLRVEGDLGKGWLRALPSLCDLLHNLPDADSTALLVLRPVGRNVLATVRLGDGRVTERLLQDPSELVGTAEALLVIPPLLAAEAAPVSTPRLPDDEVPTVQAHVERPAERWAHYLLGVSIMSRIEGSPTYLSLGVQGFAALRIEALTLALAARWDGFQTVVRDRPRHLEMSTEGGGAWVLYRLSERPAIAVDAGFSLWLLAVMQTHSEGADERGGVVADVRAGTLVRASLGREALRTSVGLELELSRRRLRDELHLDEELPTLPAWSLGVTVGVAWEA